MQTSHLLRYFRSWKGGESLKLSEKADGSHLQVSNTGLKLMRMLSAMASVFPGLRTLEPVRQNVNTICDSQGQMIVADGGRCQTTPSIGSTHGRDDGEGNHNQRAERACETPQLQKTISRMIAVPQESIEWCHHGAS